MKKHMLFPLVAWVLVMAFGATGCRLFTGLIGQDAAPTRAATLPPRPSATSAPAGTQAPAPTRTATTPPTAAPGDGPPAGPDVAGAAACVLAEPAAAGDAAQDWAALDEIPCYQITLDLSAGTEEYRGAQRVSFTNRTGAPLPELVFRLYPNSEAIYGGELEVTSALVDGQAVEPELFLVDETALRLALPAPLADGQTAVVELAFTGRLNTGSLGGQAYGVFRYSEEHPLVTLANAYPILAEWEEGAWQATEVMGGGDAVVAQMANYQVRLITPPGWKVAASGTAVAQEETRDRQTVDFLTGPVREFMAAAGPTLVLREQAWNGITIRHWGVPETGDGWQEALDLTAKSLELFTERFGPYPYAEIDVVTAPLNYASGVEYPGLVLIQTDMYGGFGGGMMLGTVIPHEVAHQWWYGVVGNDVLEQPWLDEALATYSALLYAQEYDRLEYQGTLAFYRTGVRAYENENGEEPVNQPVEAFQGREQAYAMIVYLKGGLFFHDLREEIGDVAFFGALQQYYQDFRYREATTPDLLSQFEASCTCELDSFYAAWGVGPQGE